MTDPNPVPPLGANDRYDPQLLPDTSPPAKTRDRGTAESPPPGVLGGPHARNHVVVTIGIDRYEAWPHLGNAVNDARRTSEVFCRLGFREAHSLVNQAATGDAIRKLVTDDLSTLGVNDSLVIFFAG